MDAMTATRRSRQSVFRSGPSDSSSVEPRLVAFLHLLAGRAETGALLEIRWRRPRGMGQVWVRVDDLERAARMIETRARETDVYVGCAPRTHRAGGREAIASAWALWADLDEPDLADRLAAVPVPPSAVVRSGSGGAHLYWALREPIAGPELESANRRLTQLLGADPSSADAARILRLPFTLNHKSSPPKPVVLERLHPGRAHVVEHVVGTLRSRPVAAPPRDPRPGYRRDDPLRSIPPRVYVEALLGVRVTRRRKIRCPFHPDRAPSLHVYATPERGWFCFGCRRGGSVFDLAAELWSMETRGPGFLRLRRRLRATLGARGRG
jgi:hypothetical protein